MMKKLLALLAIPAAALLALLAASEYALRHRYDLAERPLPAVADSATLARGRHLATAIGKCVDCHAEDFGGKVVVDHAALGTFAGPNLTGGAGGIGPTLTLASIERAVRHGVGRDGRGLRFMPSADYQHLTDEDIAALALYVQSLPPVDRASVPSRVGPLGRALYLAGKLPLLAAEAIDHDRVGTARPARGTPRDEGAYLARTGGCHGCHGETLTGGRVPGTPPELPPAADISARALRDWSYADFERVMRTGVRPDGRQLHPFMPYAMTKLMTDGEIAAVFAYLRGGEAAGRQDGMTAGADGRQDGKTAAEMGGEAEDTSREDGV